MTDPSTGVATTTVTPAAGSHSYTASYAPADATQYDASASPATPYTITGTGAPTDTTTTLTASPQSPQPGGTMVTLTSTTTPAAPGTVTFKDGSTTVGSSMTDPGTGVATTTVTPAVGSHSFTADFAPTDSSAFKTSSSSPPLSYTTTPPPTPTKTTLAVTPASPQVGGATLTLTSTTTPAVAGTVQFMDGATGVGTPVTVDASTGVASTTTVPSVGSHSFTAVFTAADPTAYGQSTSPPVPFTITAPAMAVPTTTGVTATQPSGGGPLTLTSTTVVTGGSAHPAGSVQFADAGSNLGGPVPVDAGGGASYTSLNLPLDGVRTFTAAFTPTDPASFAGSSGSVNYTVQRLTTSTSIATSASSVAAGTTITLTATVSPANAGAVEFFDGAVDLGAATDYSGTTGKATKAVSPAVGTHRYTAQFTPSDTRRIAPSFSAVASVAAGTVPGGTTTTTTLTLSSSGTFVKRGQSVTLTGVLARNAVGVANQSVVLTVTYADGVTNNVSATTTDPSGGYSFTTSPLYNGFFTTTALGVTSNQALTRVIVTYRSAKASVHGHRVTITAETRPGFLTSSSRQERVQLQEVTAGGRPTKGLQIVNARQRRFFSGEAQGTNQIVFNTLGLAKGTYYFVVKVLGTPVNTGASSSIITVKIK